MTTPVIEQLKVHEASVSIAVDMDLAGIPVTITGQYNIHSNCFYPSIILPVMNVVDGNKILLDASHNNDLEAACGRLGWDYDQTYADIQEAVEKRNQ